MQNNSNELRALREQVARYEKLKSGLAAMRSHRETLAAQERELYTARMEEAEDVENLEAKSLARYMYALFGNLDERLDKERMEARAAAVKHDAAVRELEDLDADIAEAEAQLAELEGCRERYDAALERRAKELKNSDTGEGAKLREIESELAKIEYRRRETKEAISAGKSARQAAEDVADSLSSASAWSVVDVFTDSFLADAIKYGRINDAQYAIERLRSALRRFGAELEDVGASIDVNIGDFLGFADFFFDGFLVDMYVHSRINDSLRAAETALERIESANARLEKLLADCDEREARLDAEYERIVTGEADAPRRLSD